jgi:hypothetical protein
VTLGDDSGLFEPAGVEPSAAESAGGVGRSLDAFSEAAKSATALATKLRTTLNALAENTKQGKVSSVKSQLGRASETVDELATALSTLAAEESALGTSGSRVRPAAYIDELVAALSQRGITARRGPEPYWLVYPAWFQVRRTDKDVLEVLLNGTKIDTVHPEYVADRIAACVGEKFDPKKFADGLQQTRTLLRRVGAHASSIALDDLYDVYQGKKASAAKEFTRADFHYSVHRLAEALEQQHAAALSFPPSNKSDILFFTQHGEGRKYLMVDFDGSSAQ